MYYKYIMYFYTSVFSRIVQGQHLYEYYIIALSVKDVITPKQQKSKRHLGKIN